MQLDMVLDSTDGTALLLGGTCSSLHTYSYFCHMHTPQLCACLTLLPAKEGARMTELKLVATDGILPEAPAAQVLTELSVLLVAWKFYIIIVIIIHRRSS